jgi:hypothetical protein
MDIKEYNERDKPHERSRCTWHRTCINVWWLSCEWFNAGQIGSVNRLLYIHCIDRHVDTRIQSDIAKNVARDAYVEWYVCIINVVFIYFIDTVYILGGCIAPGQVVNKYIEHYTIANGSTIVSTQLAVSDSLIAAAIYGILDMHWFIIFVLTHARADDPHVNDTIVTTTTKGGGRSACEVFMCIGSVIVLHMVYARE